jgi:hypothetical protein
MAEVDWYKCRFLESSENLKPLVKKRFGREPSTSIAREIVACLQQGRLFYEAASSSPLEIKPLQLYYGMVGFSKALVLAQHLRSLSTLQPAHGLKDISANNSRIADLRLKIDGSGTFQEFNDVISELNRVSLIMDWTKRVTTIFLPTAKSAQLDGIEMSLQETLSRIPRLESLYKMTFGEDALTDRIDFDGLKIQINDVQLFSDRQTLEHMVNRWRTRFPFLKKWRLDSAQHGWGNSIMYFRNMDNSDIDEFSKEHLREQNDSFHAIYQSSDQNKSFLIPECLDPLAGGYTGGARYAISPINKLFLSEYSLHYMCLFLLSSLVRYRPQIWTNAISGSSILGESSDDKSLSLIELFLDLNRNQIPEMVFAVLNPSEDQYA